jgi:hypothetical protein
VRPWLIPLSPGSGKRSSEEPPESATVEPGNLKGLPDFIVCQGPTGINPWAKIRERSATGNKKPNVDFGGPDMDSHGMSHQEPSPNLALTIASAGRSPAETFSSSFLAFLLFLLFCFCVFVLVYLLYRGIHA